MTKKLLRIQRRHARELFALRARQDLETAAAVAANRLTRRQQAHCSGISLARVIKLRRIWANYDPTKCQPWDGDVFVSPFDRSMRAISPATIIAATAGLEKKGASNGR